MVSGGITKNGLSKIRVDPCRHCSLRVRAKYSFECSVVSVSMVDVPDERGDCKVLKKFYMLKM